MQTKALQIAIKAIPETGLTVAIDLGPEWFDRWREEDPGLEFADTRITGQVQPFETRLRHPGPGQPLRPDGAGLQPLPGVLPGAGGH